MESYWRSAPTAEDFDQLVDPDAKAPCESASKSTPRHCLAGLIDGADGAGRGGSGRPDGDVGGGRRARRDTRSTTGCEQARRLDPAMFKKNNGVERRLTCGPRAEQHKLHIGADAD